MIRNTERIHAVPRPADLILTTRRRLTHVMVAGWFVAVLGAGGGTASLWCQAPTGDQGGGPQVPAAAPPAPESAPTPEAATNPLSEECVNLAEVGVPQNKASGPIWLQVAPCVILRNKEVVSTSSSARVNGSVTVVLRGLRDWVRQGRDPNHLRLYLAGRMLPDSVPTLINLAQGYVNFDLKLDPSDRALWVQVLTEARRQHDNLIPISVGLSTEKQPFDSSVYLAFKIYPWYTPLIFGLLGLLFAALLWLGARYDLLRDTVADAPAPPARRPFSLGRVQMAMWFYLVVAAFLYIWMVTSEHNTPTASVLTLIGISAGTGLAAVFVDSSKGGASANQRAGLESQRDALVHRIAEIRAANPADGTALHADLQERLNTLAQVTADIARLPPLPAVPVSRGIVRDLLGGGDDMSFHRFQMAVWTLVLALIFLTSVYADLAMPDFSPSLLGLMGISSGTYVGFKFPENAK